MKETKRNEKAITLIALIITIIILVILAAVSIRAVTNMGIVGHAINGTEGYAKAGKKENEVLEGVGSLIEDALGKIDDIQSGRIAPTKVYATVSDNGCLLFSNNEEDINKYLNENNISGDPINDITNDHYSDVLRIISLE